MAPVKAVAVLTKFNPIHAKTAQTKRRASQSCRLEQNTQTEIHLEVTVKNR